MCIVYAVPPINPFIILHEIEHICSTFTHFSGGMRFSSELIALEKEYTRLIDTVNAPIIGVDTEGQLNIWNQCK